MNKKILIVILITPLLVIGIFLFKKITDVKRDFMSPTIDKGKCYIELKDTIKQAYFVSDQKDIDLLIKYYDSKIFKKYDYDIVGYSLFKQVPINKIIEVKNYLQDSSIISFSYQVYEDSINTSHMYGYMPVYAFHPIAQ